MFYFKILRSKKHYVKVLQKTLHFSANERLSIAFMSNGKRELIPRDQVSPLLAAYCSLFLRTLEVSSNFLSKRIF